MSGLLRRPQYCRLALSKTESICDIILVWLENDSIIAYFLLLFVIVNSNNFFPLGYMLSILNMLRIYQLQFNLVDIHLLGQFDCPHFCFSFVHCVPAYGIVVTPALPVQLSISRISLLYPSLSNAIKLHTVTDPIRHVNVTVLVFETNAQATIALNESIAVRLFV